MLNSVVNAYDISKKLAFQYEEERIGNQKTYIRTYHNQYQIVDVTTYMIYNNGT